MQEKEEMGMYQGFYNLTSGMLTQQRNLNVISNNMVNIQTAGYKRDKMTSSTFEEEMLIRTGRRSKGNPEELAVTSKIKTAQQTYVNYEQGNLEDSGGLYDFALAGDGFFCIQTPQGVAYTRNGSFYVDEEGYLMMNNGLGRVLGTNNQPIQIPNEEFGVDSSGTIRSTVGAGEEYGTIRIVDFDDYEQLHKEDYGVYSTSQTARDVQPGETTVVWQMLEGSNVNMIEEMTSMMSAQRALQSAAQVLKMYDQIMSKSATDVGRL